MGEKNRQKQLRFRSYRYAVLSLILIVVLLTATGCAVLLIGDNRKAYDLMVEASAYFKYPSSVRIESGEISGDGMYCVIKGKNGYGNYRSDSYYVSSSGYPHDEYDRRCYSDKLNVDLINSALAAHFNKSSDNIFGIVIGGSNMSSEGAGFIYFIVIVVFLCLNGYLASNASDMADEKGFDKRKWFHLCFWLGPIPYIIIAAMPDRTMYTKQDKTNELLAQMIETLNTTAEKQTQNRKDDVSALLPKL